MNYKGIWVRGQRYKVLEFLNRPKFRLMDLPPELRHNVLRYLPDATDVGVYLSGHNGMSPTAVELPVTARAGDRVLRQETIMMTIEQTTFAIHSGPGNASFQTWLEHVDLRLASDGYINGFDAVKSLSFPYFSRYPHSHLLATATNNDIELMLKCRNLESVSMEWAGQELCNYDAATGMPFAKPVQQLRSEYRLDRMLDLRRVKKLVLVGRMIGDTTLSDLATWLGTNMPHVDGKRIQVVVV